MGKPLSWKWKLAVAAVIMALFMVGWLFSGSGHTWMKAKIEAAYNELPESERRDSPLADRYLLLAWWAGNIRGEDKEAMKMYLRFCGLEDNKSEVEYIGKLKGLCDEKGKTGWGPAHPRAPEAYWCYLELYQPTTSTEHYQRSVWRYYRLFYTWCRSNGPDKKIHPYFKPYWDKIMVVLLRQRVYWPPDVNRAAPGAPDPPAAN